MCCCSWQGAYLCVSVSHCHLVHIETLVWRTFFWKLNWACHQLWLPWLSTNITKGASKKHLFVSFLYNYCSCFFFIRNMEYSSSCLYPSVKKCYGYGIVPPPAAPSVFSTSLFYVTCIRHKNSRQQSTRSQVFQFSLHCRKKLTIYRATHKLPTLFLLQVAL
jgi:hypothetical protein